MAKIGLTKLGLKKNTDITTLEWNGQIIEIKQYLPMEEKLKVIENIVNKSLDDNNFANPARLRIHSVLEAMYAYTNINFTEKQKEDFLGLYDLVVSSGLWDAICMAMDGFSDFAVIEQTTYEVIGEIYRYKTSLLGMLEAASIDYQNLDLDATKIQEKLGNRENVEFLEKVMDKMG